MASPEECLCQSCSNDVVDSVLAMNDPPAFLCRFVTEQSLLHVGAVEYFPSEMVGSLVEGGVVTALLDVLTRQPPTAEPTRLAYCAARSAGALIREMPTDSDVWHAARVNFAERIASLLRSYEMERLTARQQTFAGILCCCLDALFPKDRFRELGVVGGTRVLRLDRAGRRVREDVCDRESWPRSYVFRTLFQVVAKPRLFCEMEKELHGDSSCLHSRSLSVVCKLLLNQGEGERAVARRIICREVPSALSTLMGIVRDPTSPDEVLAHALYSLAELLKEEGNGEANSIGDLLRLAPDAFFVLATAMYRVDEMGVPALLDVLFLLFSHTRSLQGHNDRHRPSPFSDIAILLFKGESPTPPCHIAACLLLRALLASPETKFSEKHILDCSLEICGGHGTVHDLVRSDFDTSRAFRVARELVERNVAVSSSRTETSLEQRVEVANRLSAKWRTHTCEHCGVSDDECDNLYAYCRACRRSHFCTREHQKAAWRFGHHKALCEAYLRFSGDQMVQRDIVVGADGLERVVVDRDDDVHARIQELADCAARAGIPNACVIFVVEVARASQGRSSVGEVGQSTEEPVGVQPSGFSISWLSPLEWVGLFSSRMLSFEMDPRAFPSLMHRQAALDVQYSWMNDMRQSWWAYGERRGLAGSNEGGDHGEAWEAGDSVGMDGTNEMDVADETDEEMDDCGCGAADEERVYDDPIGRTAREGRRNMFSSFYQAGKREYRVGWWRWTAACYREVGFSHCRISDGIQVPKLSSE